MSEIKVNKITPRAACGTTQLGDSGDTFTIPSGATISNLGTATGFGGTGVVSWDTASIKTTGFTAVTGTGYFCNTTGGAFSVTLPLSPSAGDVIGVADYAKTFDTDNCTLLRNGSNIGGDAFDSILTTEGLAVTLVYVDGTKGWIVTDSGLSSNAPTGTYIVATGGCITTCGNYKVHTFNSPGNFCVSAVGNPAGSLTVDYMVIAGGGGGGGRNNSGGGAGAGGYRESPGTASGSYTVSPLGAAPAVALPVSATPYPITVGGGGTGACGNCSSNNTNGSVSTFSTICSAGGGYGGNPVITMCGNTGGSGGGGGGQSQARPGGAGNTPPTSPAQGTAGAASFNPPCNGGGGGGAICAGTTATAPTAGAGGAGATSSINFSPTARAGGGGGGKAPSGTGGVGGAGGGGSGGGACAATNGGCNSGGGGGGSGYPNGGSLKSGNGGSGVVIIRYQYQ